MGDDCFLYLWFKAEVEDFDLVALLPQHGGNAGGTDRDGDLGEILPVSGDDGYLQLFHFPSTL